MRASGRPPVLIVGWRKAAQCSQKTDKDMNPGYTRRKIIRTKKSDLDAEAIDPYVEGWEAGDDLDDPPPCPYEDGELHRLWRKGFSDRVDAYIAHVYRRGGLSAPLVGKAPELVITRRVRKG